VTVARRRRRLALIAGALTMLLVAAGCGAGKPKPDTGDTVGKPEDLVDVRTITYKSSLDGAEVTGLAAVPRAVKSRGCVIWQYGFRSTKEDSHYAWQPLAALGLTTFSIDFRYHGARGNGAQDFQEILAQPAKFRAMVRGTIADLRSAIDVLERQPYCHNNVAYVGVSLGGAIGTIVAADDQRVRSTVLAVTPGTWNNVETIPPGVSEYDPDRYVGKIAPRPLLILSGLTDTTVSIANSRKLQAAAGKSKTVVDFDGGHDPAVGPDGVSNANTIFSFLLRTVVEPTYGIAGGKDGTFFAR